MYKTLDHKSLKYSKSWVGGALLSSFRPYSLLKFALLAGVAVLGVFMLSSVSYAGTWTPLKNQPTFLNPPSECAANPNANCAPPGQYSFGGVLAPLLLTDGSVLVAALSTDIDFNITPMEYLLKPDNKGSYINGTWTRVASIPANYYYPLYFASAVLPDGRVIYQGGEYLLDPATSSFYKARTSLGAIYDPVADTWTSLNPPPCSSGNIGDGQSVILNDGTYMVMCYGSRQAFRLNLSTMTWTETGTATKYDRGLEEGWTLLPNGKVLTVDALGFQEFFYTSQLTTNPALNGPFTVGPFASITPHDDILPLTAQAVVAPQPCAPLLAGSMTNKIGVYIHNFPMNCSLHQVLTNMANAGAIAALAIEMRTPPVQLDDETAFAPIFAAGAGPDALGLIDAINTNPNLQITISIPVLQGSYNTELYDPITQTWASAGVTPVRLTNPLIPELGPAVLRPDGTVFALGGYDGNSAIYDSKTGKWSTGPKLPNIAGEGQLGVTDGPGALLPNGNVLFSASLPFNVPAHMFEFDGKNLIEQPTIPNAPLDQSENINMLVLPTGQILEVDFNTDVEIYTPSNKKYDDDWAPVVTNAPLIVKQGGSYVVKGKQFNGMSQGAMFGDDNQSATNYPLVRITNLLTHHVFYNRTHDHSNMGVATGKLAVSTHFDVPKNQEIGLSILEVVANGIPSKPVLVLVLPKF